MAGNVFLRHELKYMLDEEKLCRVMSLLPLHMALDKYGKSEIRSLYFDTDDFLLVRRSIQKPIYKEKLRLRSYGAAAADRDVFVELKRKYNSVVYKRRTVMSAAEALLWLSEGGSAPSETQIAHEINYFLSMYGRLSPKVFLSYDREAFFDKDGSDLRVTFDTNILARTEHLTLEGSAYGEPLLEPRKTLMEIKCSTGMPIWMVHMLSEAGIYKTSYSKYGTAYNKLIIKKEKVLVNV